MLSCKQLRVFVCLVFLTQVITGETETNTTTMPSYKVEQVTVAPLNVLGEGPHWDADRQCLYWNDIYGGTIHRYDEKENKAYQATVEGEPVIGFIIPVFGHPDQFILGTGTRVIRISWDGKSPKATKIGIVGEVEQDRTNTRFNDAKVDPRGRLFAGTMRLEECGDIFAARWGTFYRYTKTDGFKGLKTHIGVSNGLTWNEKTNKFYYIDSCDLDVKEFDYEPRTGEISNERKVINLDNGVRPPPFVPDGMTSDTEGNLYVATFGGSKILKINPTTGKIIMEIMIPAEQVTSCAFGGPNLDTLYVTTAKKEFKNKQPPPAGGLFKITGLGVTGVKMYSVLLD
ncbi:regucalcin-like isoform X2 [Culicoides brevitarsis]|uniref:regucalcin-like isoform X2 n=1 Tax=Culicoides brevitarsis TaxID=469753 RepID=UPI00307B3808